MSECQKLFALTVHQYRLPVSVWLPTCRLVMLSWTQTTVLSKSLGSAFRRISWLFGAFWWSFAWNESSAIFRRIFGTPIVLIRANFRTIFRCARNIAAKIRRKCACLENSLRIFERTFVRFFKRFWGKFKRHDRNMNLLSVVPAWNTAVIYLQTSVYNQLDRVFYRTHLDILLEKQNCVLKIQRHCTSYCYSHDTRR